MNDAVVCTASALVIRSLPTSDSDTDTGKRFIRNQRAVVYGKSLDGDWLYVDAPAARGWVARSYTAESAIELPTPSWPSVPNGLAAIKRLYGEPGKVVCQAGRVKLPDRLMLSWEDTFISTFACHKLVEDVFNSVFRQIHQRGFWGLLQDYGGCYNPRTVRGTTERASTHAWGIAVDLNTKANPLGKPPTMDKRIIAVFEDHGFVWGGTWARPDGMHFQRAAGY